MKRRLSIFFALLLLLQTAASCGDSQPNDTPVTDGGTTEAEETEADVFAGLTDKTFDGREFNGAELTAVFGGVKCDLRNAVIEKDCAITAESIFGGVSDKKHRLAVQDAVTIYINATCMFGGVDIK